ncbi:hypothetical protein ANO11243_018320 [Dothideomycetidae sp. 11243]|nr:hypothetical protein ANO11243_018320 [fungal sp. No.11243]
MGNRDCSQEKDSKYCLANLGRIRLGCDRRGCLAPVISLLHLDGCPSTPARGVRAAALLGLWRRHATTLLVLCLAHGRRAALVLLPQAVEPLGLSAKGSLTQQREISSQDGLFLDLSLLKLVNRAVIGNKTANPMLTGIVGMGTYNEASVNLAPYFTGALNSTNNGGSSGESVNFLDDGGATPIMNGMPSNGNMTSNQYLLLTHLYEFFGALLGCTDYGMTGYPAYGGVGSMYEVHKFMDLDANQVGYFVEQVGLSAASFGVVMADVTAVGKALAGLFDVRCAPNTIVISSLGPLPQSICIADDCPLSPNATCGSYETPLKPVNVSSSSSSSGGASSSSSSGGGANATSSGSSASRTGSAPATQTTNAASSLTVRGLVAAAALLFAL